MKRAARKDSTQKAIVQALRAIGCTVLVLNQEGIPDLLVSLRDEYVDSLAIETYRLWLPIEVKTGTGKLTKAQVQLSEQVSYPVVHSVAEALALFGVKV